MTWRTYKRGLLMECIRAALSVLIGLNLDLDWKHTITFICMVIGKDLLFWMNKQPSIEELTDTEHITKPPAA